ncbi:ParB/RepB/Spo0J family partition protein [Xanthomonas albilineans]|uniref:Probable chromosome-partitioning protein ParB n=1 Tax=Xanthomonas albilineans (strain GPE PC73 / CFBP 7063) TaxID=380358 RepID=D2U8H0_XANAP|nr:ParB/RepB/Spo0J family partition protein [Xanthomonas albilineans]PPU93918.1 chromosome partitioning protein ParB [Xanthomonas albilineans]QHQ26912.1 putative chromosome partitioning protein [Xanthomonas albilineans]CBA14651.1 probable chromosome partitioning protein [Xanthomonas albilineans GPE PC73]
MSAKPPALGAKKRGLGRGLEALLGSTAASTPTVDTLQPGDSLRRLPVGQLQPGKYQPRQEMDQAKLQELAESIKAQGVIQPIVVRELVPGTFEIVAGERRWRASQLAGLSDVPVVVRELDDRTVIAMALIENIQREDLNPLEEALALQRLIDEFSLTHAEAAEAVGRSRASVSNLLRLLELPPTIRMLLEARRLEMGHARALLTLSPELASRLASDAADQGWSVREVEHRAQQFAAGKVPSNRKPKPGRNAPQADIASLETELSESLGTKVAIAHGAGGKGKLVIHYTDLDTLDGVLERLRGKTS